MGNPFLASDFHQSPNMNARANKSTKSSWWFPHLPDLVENVYFFQNPIPALRQEKESEGHLLQGLICFSFVSGDSL
jgi:hypothetical protein